jgi:hypothetical protein
MANELTKTGMANKSIQKESGYNSIWDGPLDTTGFPMGKGSSSGINGMQVKKYPCKETAGIPITQRVKNR